MGWMADAVTGLCAGLAVSTFSRSLALILGLLVVGVQVCPSQSCIKSSVTYDPELRKHEKCDQD